MLEIPENVAAVCACQCLASTFLHVTLEVECGTRQKCSIGISGRSAQNIHFISSFEKNTIPKSNTTMCLSFALKWCHFILRKVGLLHECASRRAIPGYTKNSHHISTGSILTGPSLFCWRSWSLAWGLHFDLDCADVSHATFWKYRFLLRPDTEVLPVLELFYSSGLAALEHCTELKTSK